MEYLRKIFSSFLNFFSNLQQRKARIIFFGLDNAGKTSLLRRLKDGTFSQHPPTLFSHQEEVRIGNVNVKAIDIGGHQAARKAWKDYILSIDAIFFVVDSSEEERLEEAAQELQQMIELVTPKESAGKVIPIVVLGNKIDRKEAIDRDALIEKLGLQNYLNKDKSQQQKGAVQIEVFMCSVAKKAGYQDAFAWVDKAMAQK